MESFRAAVRSGIVLWAMMFSGILLKAQQPGTEIRVQVHDPSGAAMQAEGKLENLATGTYRNFQTDSQGLYIFKGIANGHYRLEVSRSGFATQFVSVSAQTGVTVSKTITLALGAGADRVEVIATTPLAGVDLPSTEIAAPVQTATGRDLDATAATNFGEFLNRRMSSIYVNEIQGNPFQPDVNYRGYTASPLLGTPQGLSIYLDGVRLNQPFGDVVAWDLIPSLAIAEVSLMPGSNPIFGLNTLGGAISLVSKDGRHSPGTVVELSGGSFGRKQAELQHGGSSSKGLDWFIAGNMFFEDGWRTASPTNVRQFFGRLGWQGGATSAGLTVSYANNSLTGNGLQEQRLLARNYSDVYTIPDETANRAPSFSLFGRHSFRSNLSVSGVAYYRYIRTRTLNGDLNENSLDQSVYQPSAADIRALTAAGFTGFPTSGATAANTPFPSWRCIAQALQRDEPGEKCNALLNRTGSQQHNFGLSGQVTHLGTFRSHHNQFTAGAAYDGSIVNFRQSTQLGYLNPDRTVTGVNAFADGVTGGHVDDVPFDTRVDLHGIVNTGSVYGTNTISSNKWSFTLSGRYNRTTIDNHDRIQPISGSGSLTGSNSFGRFNPAAGLTFALTPGVNGYFGYSEGSRAPTSIELGCSDPNQPCKLPNALAGDPPLKQVVTRTVEAGLRGGSEHSLNWEVGWFRSENHDDLWFVASTQTGFGYFKNFGQTRRQGAEASVRGNLWRFNMGGGYTFLDATYQSAETVDGSSNSMNDAALAKIPGTEGTIQITAGDRIPLIPHHLLKAFAGIQATKQLSVDLDLFAASTSYARGNENNLSRADGTYYLGPGTSPGYGVLNLGARYQVHPRVQLFVQINNVLDHRYYTAAQLGPTGLTSDGAFIARPLPAISGEFPVVHATFYAPGAPIGAWGGVRVKF